MAAGQDGDQGQANDVVVPADDGSQRLLNRFGLAAGRGRELGWRHVLGFDCITHSQLAGSVRSDRERAIFSMNAIPRLSCFVSCVALCRKEWTVGGIARVT